MPENAKPRVMFVDDEENVLQGIARLVRSYVEPTLFTSPVTAAQQLALGLEGGSGCYAAVVSDMRMPGMSGADLLKHARSVSPDTTRLLLTGYADLRSAMAAVNEGNIFRFLTKPCSGADLRNALDAALEQHRLVVDRRELLDHTLRGAVEALVETLAMAQPAAFTRATRLRRLASDLAAALGVPEAWQIEVAAQLGEIGVVTLPDRALDALANGGCSDPAVRAMLDQLPHLADDVLRRIPRLDAVREIVREQAPVDHHDGPRPRCSRPAQVLQAAREFDANIVRGFTDEEAIALLRQRPHHDKDILDALQKIASVPEGNAAVRECDPDHLRVGAVLAADVHSSGGLLLVARGQTLNDALLTRLRNYASLTGLAETPVIYVAR
jgi:response regulator RpfG family c-di-GMP phosphodiesterase